MAPLLHEYAAWFKEITGHEPYPWQCRLGEDPGFRHRLIRIPTGMGKTAGASLAWLFHRAVRNDPDWPRRLVYVLPAHALVEPIEAVWRGWLERAGLTDRVAVHVLSAATDPQPWVFMPEAIAVLIGTQNMVLSRALGRGHGTPRALWPVEMALLNHDALWVLDEVQ
jgi:CRISPR-associated endonuclease/helicase Cas3